MKRLFLLLLLTSACPAYAMEDEESINVRCDLEQKIIIADSLSSGFSVQITKSISDEKYETRVYEFIAERGYRLTDEENPWVLFMIRIMKKKIAEFERTMHT